MDGYCHPILELAKTVLELQAYETLCARMTIPSDGIQEPLADEKPRRRAAQTD